MVDVVIIIRSRNLSEVVGSGRAEWLISTCSLIMRVRSDSLWLYMASQCHRSYHVSLETVGYRVACQRYSNISHVIEQMLMAHASEICR